MEGELRSREYVGKKAAGKNNKAEETTQRIWEIRVASILKLDRAEKSAPEEQEQDDSVPEESAF